MLTFLGRPSHLVSWLLALVFAASTWAGDLNVRAQLVWGTDQTKPKGSEFTPLDTKSREKLRRYKWQNYWVVNQAVSQIGTRKPALVNLSEKCAIDLRDLGNGFAEIRLYELKAGSDPKLVKPVQHSLDALKKGEYCILAGDDKAVWDDAWFVIVTVAP